MNSTQQEEIASSQTNNLLNCCTPSSSEHVLSSKYLRLKRSCEAFRLQNTRLLNHIHRAHRLLCKANKSNEQTIDLPAAFESYGKSVQDVVLPDIDFDLKTLAGEGKHKLQAVDDEQRIDSNSKKTKLTKMDL